MFIFASYYLKHSALSRRWLSWS